MGDFCLSLTGVRTSAVSTKNNINKVKDVFSDLTGPDLTWSDLTCSDQFLLEPTGSDQTLPVHCPITLYPDDECKSYSKSCINKLMSFFIGTIVNKSFVLFTIDSMNHFTFKLGRATPETALQPFLGCPAHRSGSLQPFFAPSDNPLCRGLNMDVQSCWSGSLGTAAGYTNKTERQRFVSNIEWLDIIFHSFATWPGPDEE
jgi:hypothetical protein